MGPARGFSERALRAIERRQMVCIGVTCTVALAIGAARCQVPSRERLPAAPLAHRVQAFAARVTLLDELMFQGSLPRTGPVPTGCVLYTPLRRIPSRIPHLVRTPGFRDRLKLGHSESSVYIEATPNPETATVALTVFAPSSGEALRIANLAAHEVREISREESPFPIIWKHDAQRDVSPIGRHNLGVPPNGATCQVIEKARLLPTEPEHGF